MKPFALCIALVVSVAAHATVTFEPPNPTSATPVVAHLRVEGGICMPSNPTVTRSGRIISISLDYPPCTIPATSLVDMPVDLGVVPPGYYDVVVGQKQLLIGVDEGFLTVSDPAQPFDVLPNTIPTTGGEITLRSRTQADLYSCASGPSPIVCDQYKVLIDGQQVSVVRSLTPHEITVNAPAHSAGAVDVTIMHGDGSLTTATAALDYFDPAKLDAAFFERVIFPTLVTGPGAFGSQWRSDAAVYDASSMPLPPSQLFGTVAANSTATASGANAPLGTMLYVPRQSSRQISFDVLARDLSRQADSLGVDLPVVREDQLYSGPFNLLLVPTEAKYRTSLRVLRVDGGDSFHLRIYGSDPQPLVDTTRLLVLSPTSSFASVVIPDLVSFYPQLAGHLTLRIEIDPESTVRGTWGFASVTNNDTQNITIISPH